MHIGEIVYNRTKCIKNIYNVEFVYVFKQLGSDLETNCRATRGAWEAPGQTEGFENAAFGGALRGAGGEGRRGAAPLRPSRPAGAAGPH